MKAQLITAVKELLELLQANSDDTLTEDEAEALDNVADLAEDLPDAPDEEEEEPEDDEPEEDEDGE